MVWCELLHSEQSTHGTLPPHTHDKHMPNPIITLPPLLERVDTDLAPLRDVGMEDLGQHGACCQLLHSAKLGAHVGGRLGYSGPKSNLILKYPPSYGVPAVCQLLTTSSRAGMRVFGPAPRWRSDDQGSQGTKHWPGDVWLPNTSDILPTWTLHPALNGGDVVLVDDDADALGRLGAEGDELAGEEAEGLGREGLV